MDSSLQLVTTSDSDPSQGRVLDFARMTYDDFVTWIHRVLGLPKSENDDDQVPLDALQIVAFVAIIESALDEVLPTALVESVDSLRELFEWSQVLSAHRT